MTCFIESILRFLCEELFDRVEYILSFLLLEAFVKYPFAYTPCDEEYDDDDECGECNVESWAEFDVDGGYDDIGGNGSY